MSDTNTASLTVLSSSDSALQLVRPGSALASALDAQGVNVDSPDANRAVSKAVQGIAKDIMHGAILLAADAGHDGARRAQACLSRVAAERAIRRK